MSPRPTTPPQHGTPACYRYGCRRPECRDADRAERKRGELRRLRGVPGHVASARIAAHIQQLTDSGWTIQDIAARAGVSYRTVTYVLAGQRTMQTRNAIKILALKPLAGPPRVDATGTRRRIQALACIGWPLKAIARRAGHSYSYFARILNGSVTTITRDTADRVARVYRDLARTPGPSLGTRTVAARNGWHSPMAWDETTIDDPDAQPDIDTGEDAELTPAERAEEARRLAAFGVAPGEIARRVGRSESYVKQILGGGRGPGWRQQYGEAA